MSISSGTYTVGVGKDYLSLKEAMDDIIASPLSLTGDLEFVCYDNTITAGVSKVVSIGNNTFTIRGAVPNKGNPNVGSVTTLNDGVAITVRVWGGGKLIVKNNIWTSEFTTRSVDFGYMSSEDYYNTQINWFDCLFSNCHALLAGDAIGADKYLFYNNKLYYGTVYINTKYDSLIHLYNNIVETNGYGFYNVTNGGGILTNNVAFHTSASWNLMFAFISGHWKAYNNIEDDNSLANVCVFSDESDNQTGLVNADEFASVDIADDNYLFLKNEVTRSLDAIPDPKRGQAPLEGKFNADFDYAIPTSKLINQGIVTPSTEDIAGLSRPNESGGYSIGCHEPEVVWV